MLILDNQIQDKHFKKSIDIVYFRKFCLFDNKSIIMYNKISDRIKRFREIHIFTTFFHKKSNAFLMQAVIILTM